MNQNEICIMRDSRKAKRKDELIGEIIRLYQDIDELQEKNNSSKRVTEKLIVHKRDHDMLCLFCLALTELLIIVSMCYIFK